MTDLLQKTAWPMEVPKPYSFFHIAFSAIGLMIVICLAMVLSRWRCIQSIGSRHDNHDKNDSVYPMRILFLCGACLLVGELYKQLFLYVVVNHGYYDWWYFPFQLCSTPMYLCLVLPFMGNCPRPRRVICTYLRDFCLLGGVMALLEPSGLLHAYWTLTLHGLLWHLLLIFLGLFSSFSGLASHGRGSYRGVLLLFGVFCLIALMINVATKGRADMFYISPYYPVTQVFFYQISIRFGILAGIVVYLSAVCAGGYLVHQTMSYAEIKVFTRWFPDSDYGRKL